MYDEDEPRLSAFRPVTPNKDEKGASEEELRDRMNRGWVKNVAAVLRNIWEKGENVSEELAADVLEFLAFYNCSEPGLEESQWMDERWHRQFLNETLSVSEKSTAWKDDGEAEQLFQKMEQKDARVYSAMICGLSRHTTQMVEGAEDRSYQLYQEMKSQNLTPSPIAFNYLIRGVYLQQNQMIDQYWPMAEELMKDMEKAGVPPTLHLFNSAFEILLRKRWTPMAKEVSLKLCSEMTHCGIRPSPGTFYNLMAIFEKSRLGLQSIIQASLEALEAEGDLKIRDQADRNYFPQAMSNCKLLGNVDLGLRLYKLYRRGTNSLLVTDSNSEFQFFSTLLNLMAAKESTDNMMKIYSDLVPFSYVMDWVCLKNVLRNLELEGRYEFASRIYADMIPMGLIWDKGSVIAFFRFLLNSKDQVGYSKQLASVYSDIVWDFKERLDSLQVIEDFRPFMSWFPDLVVMTAVLCVRAKEEERAWELCRRLMPGASDLHPKLTVLEPPVTDAGAEVIRELFQFWFKRKDWERCLATLKIFNHHMFSALVLEVSQQLLAVPDLSLEIREKIQELRTQSEELDQLRSKTKRMTDFAE